MLLASREDVPQVFMDLLVFMLAPYFMIDAEYSQWGPGIPFTDRVIGKLDYEEFSRTLLMPSLTGPICVLASLIFL